MLLLFEIKYLLTVGSTINDDGMNENTIGGGWLGGHFVIKISTICIWMTISIWNKIDGTLEAIIGHNSI